MTGETARPLDLVRVPSSRFHAVRQSELPQSCRLYVKPEPHKIIYMGSYSLLTVRDHVEQTMSFGMQATPDRSFHSYPLGGCYNWVSTSIRRPFDCLSKVIMIRSQWRNTSRSADPLAAVMLTCLFTSAAVQQPTSGRPAVVTVVKVRGPGGLSLPCSDLSPLQ